MNKIFFSLRNKELIFAMILVNFMVSLDIPIFGIGIASFIWFVKWTQERFKFRPLSRILTGIFALLSLLFIWMNYHGFVNQDAPSLFLFILVAIKVLDYVNEWDHQLIVLLNFLLIGLKFLFTIDIIWVLPGGVAFILLWRSILDQSVPRPYLYIFKNIFVALPIIIGFFIFFPRLTFFAERAGKQLRLPGFSDEIALGDLSSKIRMGELVFRAQFDGGQQFPQQKLYWRGTAFDKPKGLTWAKSEWAKVPKGFRDLPSTRNSYSVTLEPQATDYLFVLDPPGNISSEKIRHDNVDSVVVLQNTHKLLHYSGSISNESLSDEPREQLLEIPVLPPKTAGWVDKQNKAGFSFPQKLKVLENFFRDSRFFYTLKPGNYSSTDLDQFFFERRLGFCEHFASGYAILARAIGIPSRVVIGFQGGKWNQFGKFYRVTDSDAHAWVEVLDPEMHWLRIDPTGWIAPLRLSLGGEDFFNLPEEFRNESSFAANNLKGELEKISLISYLGFWFDNVNYQWTNWLLNFDKSSQENLLSKIGVSSVWVIVISILLSFVLLTYFVLGAGARPSQNLIQKLFVKLEAWAGARNQIRPGHLPPLSFIQQLARAYPEKRPEFEKFIELLMKSYEDEQFLISKKDYQQLRKSFS